MIKVTRYTEESLQTTVSKDDDGYDIEVYSDGVYNLSREQLAAVVAMATKFLNEV